MMRTDDKRRRRTVTVNPRGTVRYLRLDRADSPSVARGLAGGSRPTLSIGKGSGMPRGGGGGGGGGGGIGPQASVAAALASTALPADPGPAVYTPQLPSPYLDTPGDGYYGGGATGNPVQDAQLGSTPGATLEQIVPGYTPPPPTGYVPDGGARDAAVADSFAAVLPAVYSQADAERQERLRLARLARLARIEGGY